MNRQRRTMPQLEHIEAIEKRLWEAADTLRANSNYASNEYFLPVMGLVFLRHAYSRYLAVKDEITAALPTRGGKKRAATKQDFSRKSAIFLRPEAQFDHLVALPDGDDRARAIIAAMESIEADYDGLRGVLPKGEYQELDNDVLGQLLRTLNPDELKRVSGDVFGRIYEYFLTRFADQKAHDGGEFFTPFSLVSLIAHVLDPDRGTVLDPACGSGGMFVQSARTVEEHGRSPAERLTFRGLEKNATTIHLAKMNLAVHGLEGDIRKAITYYEDPHELLGKADYVMANPPFNVDEIDARNIYRKLTRKIYDFSPEQQQNLQAIVWLYRGDTDRFLELVSRYLGDVADEGLACVEWEDDDGSTFRPVPDFLEAIDALQGALAPFLKTQPKTGPHAEHLAEFRDERKRLAGNVARFRTRAGKAPAQWERTPDTASGLEKLVERFASLADASHELAGQADRLYKLAVRLIETCEKECGAKSGDAWSSRDITRARKAADEARQDLTKQDESLPVQAWGQLRKVRYFWRQARWLTERFPSAELRDVEGLVKLVDRAEIEANDWSLTPGRYVGGRAGGGGRGFRLRGGDAGDSCGVGRARCGGGDPGGDDQEELRSVGDMTMLTTTMRVGQPHRDRRSGTRTSGVSEVGSG